MKTLILALGFSLLLTSAVSAQTERPFIVTNNTKSGEEFDILTGCGWPDYNFITGGKRRVFNCGSVLGIWLSLYYLDSNITKDWEGFKSWGCAPNNQYQCFIVNRNTSLTSKCVWNRSDCW